MRALKMVGPAAIAAAALIAAGAPAHADSITYIDGGNVWIASPDGAVKKQLTNNASGDVKYYGPSQADNGRIAVIFGGLGRGKGTLEALDASGKLEKSGLLQVPTCGAWGQFPTALGHTRIDPAGDVIAYDLLCTNWDPSGGSTNVYTALATVNSLPVLLDPLKLSGVYMPSWLARKSGDFNDMIVTAQGGQYLESLVWRFPPSEDPVLEVASGLTFGGASFSRTGNILTYEVSEDGSDKHMLIGMKLDSFFAPTAKILGECVVAESSKTMLPSVSPNGERVTFDDGNGVKVATFSVPDGADGGACPGSTITIAPTGITPVYNAAAAPTKGGGDNGGGDNGGGDTLKIKGPSKASPSKVRKGLAFSTQCPGKCTVKAVMKAGTKTVAKDTTKLKGKGTAKVKLRARLKPSVRSVTVVITSGSKSATRDIPITR